MSESRIEPANGGWRATCGNKTKFFGTLREAGAWIDEENERKRNEKAGNNSGGAPADR